MKLSELRPCDFCGKKIATIFYVIDATMALINARAANQVLAMADGFGLGLRLAEVMAPQAEAVVVTGDRDQRLRTRLFCCQNCYGDQINLAIAVETRTEAKEAPAENDKAKPDAQPKCEICEQVAALACAGCGYLSCGHAICLPRMESCRCADSGKYSMIPLSEYLRNQAVSR